MCAEAENKKPAPDPDLQRFTVEWLKFMGEFQGESDRAIVILGAAKIDLLLYQILQKALAPEPSGTDPLLDGDRPCSTLNAKIALAHRLGLFDDGFARALHLIRRIRNDFAHEVSGCDLNLGGHRDRVRALFEPVARLAGIRMLRERVFEGDHSPATDFRLALATVVGRLEAIYVHLPLPVFENREPLVTSEMAAQTELTFKALTTPPEERTD